MIRYVHRIYSFERRKVTTFECDITSFKNLHVQELASFILIAADISSIVYNHFFFMFYIVFFILKQYRHHCNEHCTTDERRTNHSIVARRRTTRFLARTILDPGKSIQVRRHRIGGNSEGITICRGLAIGGEAQGCLEKGVRDIPQSISIDTIHFKQSVHNLTLDRVRRTNFLKI